MILAQLAHFASHTVNSLALFQEEQTVSFSPLGLWQHMGYLAKGVAIILFIESIWSLAVMIDRYLYFSAARKQSAAINRYTYDAGSSIPSVSNPGYAAENPSSASR